MDQGIAALAECCQAIFIQHAAKFRTQHFVTQIQQCGSPLDADGKLGALQISRPPLCCAK